MALLSVKRNRPLHTVKREKVGIWGGGEKGGRRREERGERRGEKRKGEREDSGKDERSKVECRGFTYIFFALGHSHEYYVIPKGWRRALELLRCATVKYCPVFRNKDDLS